MTKVLHIVGDSKFGGGSVVISNIAKGQKLQGMEVAVLTTDKNFSEYLRKLDIEVINLNCIWRPYNPFKDLWGLIKLIKFLNKSKFDIIHTHTTKAGLIGRLAGKLSNKSSIVHTVHGFAFSENSSKIKIAIFSFIEKLLEKITDKLIFVSNYHLNWSKLLKISSKNSVAIPNAVEAPRTSEKNIRLIAAEYEYKWLIVFVGRMVHEKGIFDLLNAFNLLSHDYDQVGLVFVGDGPDIAEIKNSANDSKNVHFTGFVPNPQDYLANASIFVLPSYREGLSISALEAQSLGVPSILSNIGGNIEISQNNKTAIIFDLNNPLDLVSKLKELLENEKLRESLSSKAKANYLNNYSLDIMSERYKELYKSL